MKAKGEERTEIKFDRMDFQLEKNDSAGDFEFGAIYSCREKTGMVYFANHGGLEKTPFIQYFDKRTPLQIIDPGETGDIYILNNPEIQKIWFVAWDHKNMVNSVLPADFNEARLELDVLIHYGESLDLLNIQYNTLAEGNMAVIAELDLKDRNNVKITNKSAAIFIKQYSTYKKLLELGEHNF